MLATLVGAGCFAPAPSPQSTPETPAPGIDPASVQVPSAAELAEIPDGVVLRWKNVVLPFQETITIPSGATMVRATGVLTVINDFPIVKLSHAETGRRRCNPSYVQAWDIETSGRTTCSGLAVIDPLPTEWKVNIVADGDTALADLVEVEFLSTPLDGLAALLDVSQISPPSHQLLPTQILDIPSFDGEPLHLEVTRPDTPDKVPVILASSPYNHGDRSAGRLAQWTYFVQDWAKRGYGVVMADVRGYGESGGCVEVWGPNEQKDQVVLVEWAAKQPWSTGRVGFYGQSYVGTTPVEAAVQAPEALKAIISIAPVINAYDDWHFGGVPNGENRLSPVFYQVLGAEAMARPEDPLGSLVRAGNGVCDPTLVARANDPRALYDQFYVERNFSARADKVRAAVLYTQGFEDKNVKSAMIDPWFNQLPGPKLGLFGHWIHQHPPRMDQELLFLAWMEQHLKERPVGLERLPAVDVRTNLGTHRSDAAWPPVDASEFKLYPRFADSTLQRDPSSGDASVLVQPAPVQADAPAATLLTLRGTTNEDIHLAGSAQLRFKISLATGGNAHIGAYLRDEGPNGSALATWGMVNLAHHRGHTEYAPLSPGQIVVIDLPLLATEYVFQKGHTIRLDVRGVRPNDWSVADPTPIALATLGGQADGTVLKLPLAPTSDEPLPRTATP